MKSRSGSLTAQAAMTTARSTHPPLESDQRRRAGIRGDALAAVANRQLHEVAARGADVIRPPVPVKLHDVVRHHVPDGLLQSIDVTIHRRHTSFELLEQVSYLTF
jgi:hypothetical protein